MNVQGSPIFLQVRLLLPAWDSQQKGLHGVLVDGPYQGFRRCVKFEVWTQSARPLILMKSVPDSSLPMRPCRRLMQQKMPESNIVKRQLFWSREVSRRREMLSASANASDSALPALRVFMAQNTNLNSSALPSWTPFTPYSTCSYQQLKSFACLVEFKDIQRPNPDLPAQVVVMTPSGAPLLPSVRGWMEHGLIVHMPALGRPPWSDEASHARSHARSHVRSHARSHAHACSSILTLLG